MTNPPGVKPLPILAVLGAGEASADEIAIAERVGNIAARAGWVVLTGGGPGVMEAACRGAVEAGGLTIGILPSAEAGGGYPNPWVMIPVFTGAGSARNAFNVLSAKLCVAVGGGTGTLSEIALALKNGTSVWCWASWSLNSPPGRKVSMPRIFEESDDLIEALGAVLNYQQVI